MNRNSCLLLILCLIIIQIITVFTVCSPMRNSSSAEAQVINMVKELGRKISQAQWTKNPNDNVVLSPLSISIILNLLILGTNGTSNLELKNALNYPSDLQEEAIHEVFKGILASLPDSKGVKISLNTRLFPREGSQIQESYKNVSKNYYFTEIQSLDFEKSPALAKEAINSWVSNSTQGKIVESFSGPLRPDTVLVACSVLFLSAAWENKFNSKLTKNGIFNTGRKNITIPMMTSDMNIPYFRDDKSRCEIVALPYEDNRYSMYILKPMDSTGISKLIQIENSLNSEYLDSLISQMETQRILVTIPRMKLNQKLDLEMDLKALGIKQIFSRNLANLVNLSDNQKLFLTKIFHKTFLEITEDGTSGAVVTTSVVSATSLPERFILDKPSLLFIRDNENGLIHFWAKVIRPEPPTT
ncbi:UNVERIFIED_CONTAM: hypothetical protein RMT77_004734 [Armadillidium vulgare]